MEEVEALSLHKSNQCKLDFGHIHHLLHNLHPVLPYHFHILELEEEVVAISADEITVGSTPIAAL